MRELEENKVVKYGNQAEIAAHLDISVEEVIDLSKAGVLPEAHQKHGRPIDECRMRYIMFLKGVAVGANTRKNGRVKKGGVALLLESL
ncbi:TPA: hypothetical protein ACN34R_000689 [Vibrio parahaemolyticus]|uniref:hypothetical protein n=1 Tax=Vibrio parahaemolyticus TaxID=670 RepID=UPI001120732B|nr:hypothetical protein [Vibrio parahaemolyticus]EIW7479750.1 hypothetical protein [Vibrio parahaemolyticus]EKZ9248952.1 hypothetical protein [Vibrio parahaemolyticus]ELA6677397.1 hypothetical protein [Vibrio parahaemolyticus]ELI6470708.1 hypothetical protein [Vibrio parahaemolyticus]TOH49876.1 hypothetical protein CGI80_13520 [Vibrio parahaemolyticus]